MLDAVDLITVASIIAAFTAVVLFFRIERELKLRERGMVPWVPWADWLVVASSAACLLGAILPLLIFGKNNGVVRAVSASVCSGSIMLISGYVPAILAHYRLLFGQHRKGHIQNPEPAERIVVIAVVVIAVVVSLGTFVQNRDRAIS
jgi:hypothetical protein